MTFSIVCLVIITRTKVRKYNINLKVAAGLIALSLNHIFPTCPVASLKNRVWTLLLEKLGPIDIQWSVIEILTAYLSHCLVTK